MSHNASIPAFSPPKNAKYTNLSEVTRHLLEKRVIHVYEKGKSFDRMIYCPAYSFEPDQEVNCLLQYNLTFCLMTTVHFRHSRRYVLGVHFDPTALNAPYWRIHRTASKALYNFWQKNFVGTHTISHHEYLNLLSQLRDGG